MLAMCANDTTGAVSSHSDGYGTTLTYPAMLVAVIKGYLNTTHTETLTDSFTPTDTLTHTGVYARAYAEQFSIVEKFSKARPKNFTEAIAPAESLAKVSAKTLTEAVAPVDTSAQSHGYFQNPSDTVGPSDVVATRRCTKSRKRMSSVRRIT
jgi:urate oxidase